MPRRDESHPLPHPQSSPSSRIFMRPLIPTSRIIGRRALRPPSHPPPFLPRHTRPFRVEECTSYRRSLDMRIAIRIATRISISCLIELLRCPLDIESSTLPPWYRVPAQLILEAENIWRASSYMMRPLLQLPVFLVLPISLLLSLGSKKNV